MIYIPRPDYASLSYIWTELLFSYPSVSRQFNCSTLAKLSDGYTVGTILKVVREVMTCKRVLQLRIQALTHQELLNVLSRHDPVYKEEEEAFELWYAKTPLGRRKQRAYELEQELKQMENATASMGKKK
ncbi:IQ and AAA domain-containing protein 1-like [Diaphorina citri]|uniref:IQ and AAA domain-containing protein 1-like n=1 Tax=Diaphorina citri TaxID=121845 RepID=A0A3Q0IVE1_DIACI|nr:IQ and AAA domain-containing protein 1-like [Diaphorina citri]